MKLSLFLCGVASTHALRFPVPRATRIPAALRTTSPHWRPVAAAIAPGDAAADKPQNFFAKIKSNPEVKKAPRRVRAVGRDGVFAGGGPKKVRNSAVSKKRPRRRRAGRAARVDLLLHPLQLHHPPRHQGRARRDGAAPRSNRRRFFAAATTAPGGHPRLVTAAPRIPGGSRADRRAKVVRARSRRRRAASRRRHGCLADIP